MVSSYVMFWLAWIGWAVVFAVLFSVVKGLDRLNHSVELIEARLDHMSGRLTELLLAINAGKTHGRIDRGDTTSPDLLEFAQEKSAAARVLATMESRSGNEVAQPR